MSDERSRKAAEVAMRRRRGASREHSERVKANLLGQEDLFTTCQRCGKRVQGTLDTIQHHAEQCDGH